MREDNLCHHLQEFTDEEAFYQQYHIAKKSPEHLQEFLASLDSNYLSRHKYVIPELRERLNLHFADEEWVWGATDKDIYIHKHPRYMPQWDFVHDFYEVVFAYQGCYTLHISGQELEMKPGYVCLIPPGVHHHISIYDNSISLNTKVRKSTFHSSFSHLISGNDTLVRFFLNTMYIGNYESYILFHSENDQQLKQLFSAVYLEHFNKEKAYSNIMNSLLSIIFSYLMRRYEEAMETAMTGNKRLQKLEAILVCIETNFRTITLRELSEKFYFTEQYLSKYIKENTGKTFIEIVRNMRLENARKLLSTTDLAIGSISEASGYTSVEHFTRQFKKQYAVSPTDYRKLNNH